MGKYPEYKQLNVRVLYEQYSKLMQVAIGLGAVKGGSRGNENPNTRVLFAEHVIPLFLATQGEGDAGALGRAMCDHMDTSSLEAIKDLIDVELSLRDGSIELLAMAQVGG